MTSRRIVLWFLAALACTATAVTAIVGPSSAAPLLRPLKSTIASTNTTTIGIALGSGLVIVAALRLKRGDLTKGDRSPLIDPPPERPSATAVPPAAELTQLSQTDVLGWFDENTVRQRRAAMYGRRSIAATDHDDVDRSPPDDIEAFFEELFVTVRDAYATAESCSIEDAERAVNHGTWTDDRIAAAFLAAETTPDVPGFTRRERLAAWLAPRRAVHLHLQRTLDALDELADGFISYSQPTSRESNADGAAVEVEG